jgi:hypothetical protein
MEAAPASARNDVYDSSSNAQTQSQLPASSASHHWQNGAFDGSIHQIQQQMSSSQANSAQGVGVVHTASGRNQSSQPNGQQNGAFDGSIHQIQPQMSSSQANSAQGGGVVHTASGRNQISQPNGQQIGENNPAETGSSASLLDRGGLSGNNRATSGD